MGLAVLALASVFFFLGWQSRKCWAGIGRKKGVEVERGTERVGLVFQNSKKFGIKTKNRRDTMWLGKCASRTSWYAGIWMDRYAGTMFMVDNYWGFCRLRVELVEAKKGLQLT
jgi:hypothetical protein